MTADATPVAEAQSKAKIFISYSRKDLPFADRLEAALKARGFEPLIDRTEIYAFEDWWKRIEALIGRADTVVFVLSPDAVASDVALKEVAHAASLNKRFAPIVCRRTDEGAVPETLRKLNFIFFDDPARFEASADQLAQALQTDIGWVRQHTEYGESARRWAAGGRKSGLLLRSPALEEAEHWIASRPHGAPEPTDETQAFVADSRRGATRRRNVLTGSLGAGLVIALVLAGLAFWQREVAVEQQQIAEQQRKRAEDTLAAATRTANSLVFDLAQRFKSTVGVPVSLIKDILDRAKTLQNQLIKSGQVTPDLRQSEAAALNETAEALLAIGDTKGALAAAEEGRQIAVELVATDPNSTSWQSGLAAAYERIGDVQSKQGALADALVSYRKTLATLDGLAKSHPGDARWQRELSVANQRVGGVQEALGDMAGALASFRENQAIMERLTISEPDNPQWRFDLAAALSNVAHVLKAQGNLAAALAFYSKDRSIMDGLAKSDPGNASWQRAAAISYDNIGDVQVEQGDLAGALKSYREGLVIKDRLAKSDPGNALWQRDQSVSDERIGDVQVKQDDLSGALTFFRAAAGIMERLAKSDPTNADWQSDLATMYARVGDVQVEQNDFGGGLASFRSCLAILDPLTKSHPGNTDWLARLSVINERVGDILTAQGDKAGALQS